MLLGPRAYKHITRITTPTHAPASTKRTQAYFHPSLLLSPRTYTLAHPRAPTLHALPRSHMLLPRMNTQAHLLPPFRVVHATHTRTHICYRPSMLLSPRTDTLAHLRARTKHALPRLHTFKPHTYTQAHMLPPLPAPSSHVPTTLPTCAHLPNTYHHARTRSRHHKHAHTPTTTLPCSSARVLRLAHARAPTHNSHYHAHSRLFHAQTCKHACYHPSLCLNPRAHALAHPRAPTSHA